MSRYNIQIFTNRMPKLFRNHSNSSKIIEKDRKRCEELCSLWPEVIVINGDAVEQETLIEEGIENAGAFVALTNMDEENILLSLDFDRAL